MRRAIAVAIAATLLGGCALPMSLPLPPTALDRADAAFARLQRGADVVLPLLPIERQVRARAVMAALALALGAARAAEAPDEREAAIARAGELTSALRATLR